MYTIKAVSQLTGLSTRTLRYYDEIGLLHPSNYNEAGYRLYSEQDIEQLQQIMIYKNMQLPLEQIKSVLQETSSIEETLKNHLHYLEHQQNNIAKQIKLIEKQLGGIEVSQEEKFSQLKADTLTEINAKYGEELIQKYTSDQIKAQHEHFKNLIFPPPSTPSPLAPPTSPPPFLTALPRGCSSRVPRESIAA